MIRDYEVEKFLNDLKQKIKVNDVGDCRKGEKQKDNV